MGVRELWSQQFRYQGSGRVRGAFRLRPAKHLWVGPAVLELDQGSLSVGGGALLMDLHARIDCTVLPFHVDVPVGMEVFAFISARVRLSGQVASLAPLQILAPPGIKLEDGSGQLGMDVTMSEGNLTRESYVRYQTDRARVDSSGLVVSLGGDVAFGGASARQGEEGGSAGSIWVARAAQIALSAEGSVARGRELNGVAGATIAKGYLTSGAFGLRASARGELRLSSVDLAERTGRIEARAEVSGARVNGGRGAGAWSGGLASAKLLARLDVPPRSEGTGEVQAALLDAQYRGSGGNARGEVVLSGRLAKVAIDRAEAVMWGAAQASRVSESWGGKAIDGWWGRVDIDGAEVRGGDPIELRSALRASFRDGLPMLYALAGEQDIPSPLAGQAWLDEQRCELDAAAGVGRPACRPTGHAPGGTCDPRKP